MATIAELQTKLTLDDKAFKKGMNDSINSVKSFSDKAKLGFAAAAAAITGGVVLAVKSLVDIMDESQKKISDLVDTSNRLGADIGGLQALQYAAKQSGVDVGSLNTALGKMLRGSAEAAKGTGPLSQVLKTLNIDAEAFAKLGVDQQYLALAKGITEIKSPAEQALLATQAFGKGGIEQLSAVKGNLGDLIKEFKGLGIELTDNQAKSLEAYGDSADKLATLWDGFKNQLAAALAGPLKHLLDWIAQSSIDMGGLGQAAKNVAQFILGTTSNLIGFFGAVYRGIQSSILAAEELLVVLLKISQIGTLGLSNIDLPFGLGNAGEKIASLKGDINQRSANILNSQSTQNKIQVEIKAASGFVATVVNSDENKVAIQNTVTNQIESVARGENR